MRAARRLRLIIMAQQLTICYLCSSCHRFLSLMSRRNLIAPSHSKRLGYLCYCLRTSAPVFCVSSSVVVWPFLSSCLYSVTVFVFSSPRLCLPHRSALPDLTHHTYRTHSALPDLTHHTYRTHSVYISSPFWNWFLHITLDFFLLITRLDFGLCFSCHHICVHVLYVNHLPIAWFLIVHTYILCHVKCIPTFDLNFWSCCRNFFFI